MASFGRRTRPLVSAWYGVLVGRRVACSRGDHPSFLSDISLLPLAEFPVSFDRELAIYAQGISGLEADFSSNHLPDFKKYPDIRR